MTDRSVTVRLRGDISDFNRKMLEAAAGAKAFTRELDTSTDRVANLTQTVLALGPALVPISTIAVPAAAGLANQLGVGAAAAGVAVLAFKGLGKALDAVNAYQLEPTAANLQKVHDTLGQLGPAGQDFVEFLQKARPELANLQELARAGLFPGLEKGISSLSGLLPDVERIITTISTTLGELSSEAGANLDSPKWHEFFDFLDKEAGPTLLEMGRTAGNFAEGIANLWMVFAPLETNFSQGFLGLARDFNKWADGLDKTQKFQDFIAYVDKEGPAAWDTLGALSNALLQIVEAAAPVGAATLPVIKAVSNAIADIADSDLGPAIIGIISLTSAYSRLIALGRTANTGALGSRLTTSFKSATKAALDLPAASRAYLTLGSSIQKSGYSLGQFNSSSERLRTSLAGTSKLVAGGAGLAFVMGGYADKLHLANAATLALAGSMFGPEGAAIGGTIGLVKDLRNQHDSLTTSIDKTREATDTGSLSLDQQGAAVDRFRAQLGDINEALKGSGYSGVFDQANAALKKLEASYDVNVRKAQDAQFAEAGLAGQMVNASKATRDETAAVLTLAAAHNKATNEALAGANAELAYEQALDDAAAGAKKNKKGLDANTEVGRANLQLLYTLAGAWDNLTPAQQNAKGASDRARDGFIKTAETMGATRREAERLAAAYLNIPDKAATKILVEGEKQAKAAIQAIKDLLSHLSSKTVTVTTIHRNKTVQAEGSVLDFYANGGLRESHVAQIAPAGAMRVWNEPETKGEAYIPFAPEKRARSLDIWAEVGKRLGVAGFADGAVLQRVPQATYLASTASTASGPQYARLVDSTVRMDKNGIHRLIDERVELINAGDANYAGGERRRTTV